MAASGHPEPSDDKMLNQEAMTEVEWSDMHCTWIYKICTQTHKIFKNYTFNSLPGGLVVKNPPAMQEMQVKG